MGRGERAAPNDTIPPKLGNCIRRGFAPTVSPRMVLPVGVPPRGFARRWISPLPLSYNTIVCTIIRDMGDPEPAIYPIAGPVSRRIPINSTGNSPGDAPRNMMREANPRSAKISDRRKLTWNTPCRISRRNAKFHMDAVNYCAGAKFPGVPWKLPALTLNVWESELEREIPIECLTNFPNLAFPKLLDYPFTGFDGSFSQLVHHSPYRRWLWVIWYNYGDTGAN